MPTIRDIYLPHLEAACSSGRWTPQRKEAVVRLLNLRGITEHELITSYGLTAAEIASWQDRFKRFGAEGLAARKLQTVGR